MSCFISTTSLVSIPQAVSTVATEARLCEEYNGNNNVSIPQAVSTVATSLWSSMVFDMLIECFNTASGKYCCNEKFLLTLGLNGYVSIPQAVSTVATKLITQFNDWDINIVSIPQAVSTVATAGPRNPVFMGPKIRF